MPEQAQATYGIIGYPVDHSLSPLMHNAAFKAFGADAIYKLFPLQEDELDGFFKDLHDPSSPIFGLNVTVPYKEKVMQYIDILTPFVQKTGAVNTIVISEDRKLSGHNTDAPGFLTHLAELQFNTKGKKIAILGAGGSARAIITALCLMPARPQVIKLYNRTVSRVDNLLKDLQMRMDVSIVESVISVDDLNIEQADLLINTTSIGMKEDDPCLVDAELFHPDMLVYDLIYNPKETLLLKMAKEQNAQTANGLGMLYYQGVLSLQHWTNLELDDRVKNKMREALEEALTK
jgi:shikimate dehydrogenase